MSHKNVLVLGASGYIGKAAAFALRRRGHKVTGVIRNPEKAKELIRNEIEVVVTDATIFDNYKKEFQTADVVIVVMQDWFRGEHGSINTLSTFFEYINSSNDPKKVLVYTSGGLAYKGGKERITEDSPYCDHPFMQPRIKLEQQLLAFKGAHGVVVRPSLVYGGENGHWTEIFRQAEAGKVVVYGDGENVVVGVHIEDMANAYVKIVEADPEVVSGQAIHFSDGNRLTIMEIAKAFAAAAGYTGPIEIGAENKLLEVTNLNFGYEKAEKLLQWKPFRRSSVEEGNILYRAWKLTDRLAKW